MYEEPVNNSTEHKGVCSPSIADCELEWDTCLMDNECNEQSEGEMLCDRSRRNDGK